MKKVFQAGFLYMAAFFVLFGISTINVDISIPIVHASNDQITICHATGSGSYNELHVSENATGGHFDNNGTPTAGHEDDLLFAYAAICSDPSEDPYPVPVVQATASSLTSGVDISWNEVDDDRFFTYKVLMSTTNPTPYYTPAHTGELLSFIEDSTITDYTYTPKLECGQPYYFSITNSFNQLKTFTFGNAVKIEFACEDEEAYCGDGDLDEDGDEDEYEQCDDGNNKDGDGCSSTCEIEDDKDECVLEITKSDDGYDPVAPGDTIVYTLSVKNIGDATCTNVILKDYFDENTSFVETDTTLYDQTSERFEWRFPTLAPGDMEEVELTMLVSGDTQCDSTLENLAKGLFYHADDWTTPVFEKTSVVCEEETYCGDGAVQYPNDEGTGGLDNDGNEECDGGEPVSCTTEAGYIGTKTCNNEPENSISIATQIDEPLYCVWNSCVTEDYCGDGDINGNEECDAGPNGSDTCSISCEIIGDPYSAYCGDGKENQEWEECDAGLSSSEKCSAQCQEITEQCNDLVAFKINVDEVNNVGAGDLTSDLFLGSSSYRIPSNVWVASYKNGNHFLDADILSYEDVEGLAIQRLENSLRTVMHTTLTSSDVEEVEGSIEFYNANAVSYSSDNSGNNKLETGGAHPDDVDVHDGMVDFYMWANTGDDGFYTDWAIVNSCDDPYSDYCGDGEENQEWEQCDDGIGGSDKCTEQCQLTTPPEQCNDLTLAKINIDVDDVKNWGNGNMTSDLFLGSDSYRIPSNVWLAVYWNGSYFLDDDIKDYEEVHGLAVQRLENSLRTVMYGTGTGNDKEHVSGNIEFYNANVTGQRSDDSNDNPGNNRLEKGFDGTGVGGYDAGNDEVWMADDKSHYWLTTTVADDGFYTDWGISNECKEVITVCKVDEDEKPLSEWEMTLYSSNLVTNGGFEAPSLSSGTWTIYPDTTLTSWTVESGDGLEIQNNAAGAPHGGNQLAELDSNNSSVISQIIPTIVGDDYVFGFWYSPRPNIEVGDNTIGVSVQGIDTSTLLVNDIIGATAVGGADTTWIMYEYSFTATDANTKIKFSDIGDSSNSFGGYLDDVVLTHLISDFTEENGCVEFANLTYDTYEIRETLQPNWTQIYPIDTDYFTVDFNAESSNSSVTFTNSFYGNPEDNIPVITLIGDDHINITVGDTYTDEGATADDAEDGDITPAIVIVDPVNTSAEGTYTVTYNVKDKDDNDAIEVTRTVVVGPAGCTSNCGGGGGGTTFAIRDVKPNVSCEAFDLSWRTTKNSDTILDFGIESGVYTRNTDNDTNTLNHSLQFTDLLPDTTYYYKIRAKYSSLERFYGEQSFTTPSLEQCGEVLGKKIEAEPLSCDFLRASGSSGPDDDVEGVFQYPNGSLLRDACDPGEPVFLIKDQKKWHVPTWKHLHDNYFGQRIYNVITTVLDIYPDWEAKVLGVKEYADGTLLRGPDMKIYILEEGHKKHISTLEELAEYRGQEIINVSQEVIDKY